MTSAAEHPLIERLVHHFGAMRVNPANLDAFVNQDGDSVLLLCGDPVRFPEALDVAVVLPELQRAHNGRFRLGVAERETENAVATRFGSQRWPTLVFLRDGQYVTTVSGMHDWTDFVGLIGQALAAPVSRAPSVGIAVVAQGAASSADTGCAH
jgi:hydrogenase-1 operon protein HyaE